MSRYRKIEMKTWADEKFRSLSKIPPCGQGLWFFLLTGPHTGPIPGLFRAGRAGMAEELGWDIEAFDKAFQESFDKGMAKADFVAKLVWLPKAVIHNKPESPNVVKSWRTEIDLLPECPLKDEALAFIRAHLETLGESYLSAFDGFYKPKKKTTETPSEKPLPKPSEKPIGKTMANQEQEQEQEQERAGEPPPPIVDNSTPAGTICRDLRALGVEGVNPHNPNLLRLIKAGVTADEFAETAREPKARGKGFAWLLATVEGRRNDASAKGDVAAKYEAPWFLSASGIQTKGDELGIKQKDGEMFPYFRKRVFEAAGVTDEVIRKAKIDAGEKV